MVRQISNFIGDSRKNGAFYFLRAQDKKYSEYFSRPLSGTYLFLCCITVFLLVVLPIAELPGLMVYIAQRFAHASFTLSLPVNQTAELFDFKNRFDFPLGSLYFYFEPGSCGASGFDYTVQYSSQYYPFSPTSFVLESIPIDSSTRENYSIWLNTGSTISFEPSSQDFDLGNNFTLFVNSSINANSNQIPFIDVFSGLGQAYSLANISSWAESFDGTFLKYASMNEISIPRSEIESLEGRSAGTLILNKTQFSSANLVFSPMRSGQTIELLLHTPNIGDYEHLVVRSTERDVAGCVIDVTLQSKVIFAVFSASFIAFVIIHAISLLMAIVLLTIGIRTIVHQRRLNKGGNMTNNTIINNDISSESSSLLKL